MDQQSRSLAASPHIASMNRMRTASAATGRAIPLYSATQRCMCCEWGRTLGSGWYHRHLGGVDHALSSVCHQANGLVPQRENHLPGGD